MSSHLGRYIKSVRLRLGLTPQELSKAIGYKNADKGARRILHLEQTGEGEAVLLAKVVEALNLALEGVELAQELDERDRRERGNVARPTYLVIRHSAGIYSHRSLPEEVTTQIEAENHACTLARILRCQVCLGWYGRHCSWISKSGEVYARTEELER